MAFLQYLNNVLVSADFMTKSPSLKFEGKRGYRTSIGGVINIILIAVTLVGIIYFSSEMFSRNEPMVVQSSMDGHQVGPYSVTRKGFMILVGVQFSNSTYYVNERIYTINTTAAFNEFDPEKGQVRTFANLTRDLCANYFTNEELNTTLNLKMMWCFKPDTVKVEGYWGAKKSATAKMFLNKCVNTTENNNHCLPEEEINRFIQGGILSMFTTNSFLNLKDPDFPVDVKLQNWFTSLNVDFTLDYFYNLKEMLFEDDHGLLLKSNNLKNYFYYDTPSILYYGKRGSLLATVNLQGNRYGTKIMRSYAKIQDVLTRIGGLFKALSIIAHFLTDYLSDLKFWADSVNCFTHQLYKKPHFNYNSNNDLNGTKIKKTTLDTDYERNETNKIKTTQHINLKSMKERKIKQESKERVTDSISGNSRRVIPDCNSSSNFESPGRHNSKKIKENEPKNTENSENPRLTKTYSNYYSIIDLGRDMLYQIMADLSCLYSSNKAFILKKRSYKQISDKLLSTNYLFKKMYLLEKIIDINFTEEHLHMFHYDYAKCVISNSVVDYDDSNGFVNSNCNDLIARTKDEKIITDNKVSIIKEESVDKEDWEVKQEKKINTVKYYLEDTGERQESRERKEIKGKMERKEIKERMEVKERNEKRRRKQGKEKE